jgi:hypothetical protein
MRKIMLLGAVMLTVLMTPSLALAGAGSTFGPVPISAVVAEDLSLTVTMRQNDFAGPLVTSMNFGELVDIGTGTLRSSPTSTTGTGAVAVFLSANSQGAPYQLLQTGTALNNGSATIPAGASTVVPVYAAADNGGAAMPAGATLGTAGTWVASNKVLYSSETGTAAGRTIQAIYSITDDPSAGATTGVPLDQPGGTYNGTVTFTMTV